MATKLDGPSAEVTTHKSYSDFYLQREVYDLEIGDVVELRINGQLITSNTAQYSNCHVNHQFQDKGDETPA